MNKKPTYEQLMTLIAEAAIDFQQAEILRNSLKRELSAMYATYFQAHGRPGNGERTRFDFEDPAYRGVVEFTQGAYSRWFDQRALTTRLKRKLRNLVERLERAQ
ncbi:MULTISPECIES: hypothetical protein [Pseudomonas]|uniref:DNA-binding protein n=1 Tax=Pseudomonas moraviensis R28-S TaxID=1395516 RepID=V8R9M9_9PSED|nr:MULTISPECIES: hypothetical protein [Pseudomonas]ETF07979.1 hypothetical protein PMO01_03025 [Pseudomonas moraviensis R28-S]MBP5966789.1 hypothetical protein [Pseudomonas iridis]